MDLRFGASSWAILDKPLGNREGDGDASAQFLSRSDPLHLHCASLHPEHDLCFVLVPSSAKAAPQRLSGELWNLSPRWGGRTGFTAALADDQILCKYRVHSVQAALLAFAGLGIKAQLRQVALVSTQRVGAAAEAYQLCRDERCVQSHQLSGCEVVRNE